MEHHPNLSEAIQKLEHYCAYQERCHQEVAEKLRTLGIWGDKADAVIVHLLDNNYLNEERFACAFARGKHRIKSWGRNRIVNELKMRGISRFNITTALNEIDPLEYADHFDKLSLRHWESLTEKNALKKRKKFCDFLLRKGFESDLIYDKVKILEQDNC
ncbi:regulatory protein RecX [Flavobacterium sp.]|uniref:regulatory protein RecX n=1 Tax=Flavobacterium sp. TaxID=239 RepID=UPI0026357FFE|nr:regulatory protein RecX [Flavobacterium sp.]